MLRNGSRLEKDKRRKERRALSKLIDLRKQLREMRNAKHTK